MNLELFVLLAGLCIQSTNCQEESSNEKYFLRSKCNDENPTGVSTAERIERLRELFGYRVASRFHNVDAYIVPGWDEHQSEVVSICDQRLQYISGFSQSDGLAIITKNQQVLWTSEQYLFQADYELTCDWIIMKGNRLETTPVVEWLIGNLPSDGKVGADPTLIDAATWLMWEDQLRTVGIDLVPLKRNLVNEIWLNRPSCSNLPLYPLEIEYTGQTWESKIDLLRKRLLKHKYDGMVVTSVDEVAWLLNLRGYDFMTNPLFKGYILLDQNSISLFVSKDKVTSEVKRHLNTDKCYFESHCVRIYEYESVFQSIKDQRGKWKRILLPSKQVFSGGCNYALYDTIGYERAIIHPSPVMRLKSRKNGIQQKGMHRAQLRDAIAMSEVMAELADGLKGGEDWNEWRIASLLKSRRGYQSEYMIPSRETVVAYGPNSAIYGYRPTNMTFTKVDNHSLILIGTGGHYRDGTTDITRTFHFGVPTKEMKEVYTRILMGLIDVSRSVIPIGTTDAQLDIIARNPLVNVGKDYHHSSGHGIGVYSSLKEDPLTIRKNQKNSHELMVGHFVTIGPGYYDPNNFGVQLENILEVIKDEANDTLRFQTVTIFPFDTGLIDASSMSPEQLQWMNDYNAKVRQLIGPQLKTMGKGNAFHWMMSHTGHIKSRCRYKSSGYKLNPIVMTSLVLPIFLRFGI